jgi:hypothetical protein
LSGAGELWPPAGAISLTGKPEALDLTFVLIGDEGIADSVPTKRRMADGGEDIVSPIACWRASRRRSQMVRTDQLVSRLRPLASPYSNKIKILVLSPAHRANKPLILNVDPLPADGEERLREARPGLSG